MEWASGIATCTRRIVDSARAASPKAQVFCTRKATPLTRQLSWKAVIAGGGELHRLNLSDTIMLFPEHRAFFDRPDDIKTMIARLRAHTPERAIMIEVKNEADAMAAAEAHADVIQLEKFTPDAVHRVVQGIRKREDGRPIIAAAGGVNAKNAADYARAGADTLVTSAPYHAPPVDIQVEIVPQ
jgi:molybdenum transport protein